MSRTAEASGRRWAVKLRTHSACQTTCWSSECYESGSGSGGGTSMFREARAWLMSDGVMVVRFE